MVNPIRLLGVYGTYFIKRKNGEEAMKKRLLRTVAFGVGILAASESNAALLTCTASVSGTGDYYVNKTLNTGNVSILIDNIIPEEYTYWRDDTVSWYGLTQSFTINYGSAVTINELLFSVDNNDSYLVEYSVNGTDWITLFTIYDNQGDVISGMDTFSTDATSEEYVSSIDFTSIVAQYIKISAVSGDNKYSVGEIQAYGSTSSPVPEPSTMLLFGTGLSGLTALSRKRKNGK